MGLWRYCARNDASLLKVDLCRGPFNLGELLDRIGISDAKHLTQCAQVGMGRLPVERQDRFTKPFHQFALHPTHDSISSIILAALIAGRGDSTDHPDRNGTGLDQMLRNLLD